jgi:glycosyltransferase involved in cell wall biosynthesis
LLQAAYEKADEYATRFSDQTWVVCESLQKYKQQHFGVASIYMPNSSPFIGSIYEEGKSKKNGKKLAWTGSLLTDRQFDILFRLLRKIQEIKPDMEFYFAPTGRHKTFEDYAKKYHLSKAVVLRLNSRREWQEFAATCDVGIAVYDDKFGSTEFIEPLKIWDFMMCGMPFIISCEPSISTPIKKAGIAYFLAPHNSIPEDATFKKFLDADNLKKLQKKCLDIAKEYDIGQQMKKALSRFF